MKRCQSHNRIRLITFALFIVCLVACESKKTDDSTIIIHRATPQARESIQSVGANVHEQSVQWLGSKYSISVECKADSSLPTVNDESGGIYFDNVVTIRIIHDGKTARTHLLRKDNFKKFLDPTFAKRSILLGVVFESVKGNDLLFASSVGYPAITSDEQVPFIITLDKRGDINISVDSRSEE